MKAIKTTATMRNILILALLLLTPSLTQAQSSDVWHLGHNSSPAGTVRFWTQAGDGIRAQYVTLSDILSGNILGNAATATALAANGSNCSAGSGAGGVSASGAAEACTPYVQISALPNCLDSSGQHLNYSTSSGLFSCGASSSGGAVSSANFVWSQTPGGALTGGVPATVTLSPVPFGVNGSASNLWVYLSGGTGTAETVLVTGGTAVSGGVSGTLTFTPVNSHSGAWTIGTATTGIQEAHDYLPATGGIIYLSAAESLLYGPTTITKHGTRIIGAGAGWVNNPYPSGDAKATRLSVANGANLEYIFKISSSGSSMEYVEINGNKANQTGGTGDGVWFFAATDHYESGSGLNHVRVYNVRRHGVIASSGVGGLFDRGVLQSVEVRDTLGNGIWIASQPDWTLIDPNVGGNSQPVLFSGVIRGHVYGGVIDYANSTYSNLVIYNSVEVVVIGTRIEKAASMGVVVYGVSKHIQLIGLDIRNNGRLSAGSADGIQVLDTDNITISNCHVFDNESPKFQRYALNLGSGVTNLVLVGNDFTGNLTGPYTGSATPWESLANLPTTIPATIGASLTVSGTIGASNLSGTNTGDQMVPANTTGTTSQWFSAYNNGTGAFTKSQPAFSDISSSLACSQTPALTGDVTTSAGSCATTLGSGFKGWTDGGSTVTTTTASDLVGIGGTPIVKTHIIGTSASVASDPGSVFFMVENNGTARASVVSSPTGEAGVYLGNQASPLRAGLAQDNNLDIIHLRTGGANGLFLDANKNIGFNGLTAWGGSSVGVVGIASGTAPTSSPADAVQLWSADAAAGDANLYSRNEAGISERLTGLRKRVKTQFDKTSDTSLANVTDLTFNVEAGKSYGITAWLPTTSNVAGGVKFAIAGTATATSIIYDGELDSGGTITFTRAASLGSAVCAVTAVTTSTCQIRGTITVNAAGTLTIQMAQNASNGTASSVLVGARMYLEPVGN